MQTADLAARLHARRAGKGWIARCPAHDDRRPSLSISEGRDGRVLIQCFAGCSTDAITSSLGLAMTDRFKAPSNATVIAPRSQRTAIDDVQAQLQIELG